MISVIEDYLSELIRTKMGYLKSNPKVVSSILDLGTQRVSNLETFLSGDQEITVRKGFPRDSAKFPSICIFLADEQETQDGLGDYDDESTETLVSTTDTFSVDDDSGEFTTSMKPLVSIDQVINNTTGYTLTPDEYYIIDDLKGEIQVATPYVDIGDNIAVSYTYKASSSVGIKVIYECNYRLEVWTSNADLTAELYYLLKWCMLSIRDTLVNDHGIFRQRTSGADLQPAPEWLPEFVYRRALNFWCMVEASVEETSIPYITEIDISSSINEQ